MSVIRLLISGLLVASGLTLGAFTLSGAFDAPPSQASGPVLKPWATTTSGTAKGATEAKEQKKRRADKRPPEQTPKAKPPPQQATAEWPWSWFGK